ncbi:MAG: phosphate/phosphite/phosphonate ABC transporter substrate-binding protein [Deltaproteobacteria bacterium]|nr:phosphate/phosphite/phosphonate ABC transporter substrate-binding protein [Deltaproteobacteria bacterium]
MTAILCLSFFYSCSRQDPPPPEKGSSLPKMVIGLPPERNIFRQIERYEPLMKYLGNKVGIRFELVVFPRYANIVNDFKSMELDGAFFGSLTHVVAQERLDVMVLARPESLKGVSTYHGMLFVRKDSGIGSARDMKGKRMALVDKATTAGCLLPRVYFSANGVGDYKVFLKEAYLAGTHEDVIHDVMDGKADIGAAKNTVFERMVAEGRPRVNEAVKVLAVTPEVPENGLAVRSSISKELTSKIKEALLAMDRDPEGRRILDDFGARRFVETTDKDYEIVYRYARKAGIDPATLGCLDEPR